MLKVARRIAIRCLPIVIVISIVSLAPNSFAFDGPRQDKDSNDSFGSTSKTLNVSYPLYAGINVKPQTGSPTSSAGHSGTHGSSSPTSPSVISTAPMTPGEKFRLFAKKSFMPPNPYLLSALNGMMGEATDNDHGRHMTTGDFLADSMTHAARGFAFRATANFFEKFAFATVLRQDPRYHRSNKKGARAKLAYAFTRVFITQGDRCGCNQFNASFLGGGLAAAGISNYWVREDDRTISRIFSLWGGHIGTRVILNVLSEFIGGQ